MSRFCLSLSRVTTLVLCFCFPVADVGVARADAIADAADRVLARLVLSHNQHEKVQSIIDQYRQTQKQAHDAMQLQLSAVLTKDQLEAFEKSTANVPVTADGPTRISVTLAGGHDTDPRDGGRPVVLIAAALEVPADVFRNTFKNVHPAGPGQRPTDAEARANKRVLLDGLAPYGVDDARLNEVSNFYRYARGRDILWRNTPATVDAIVRDGVVTEIVVTKPGAGYSTPPTISVPGHPEVRAVATLKFGTDLGTNGSIAAVTLPITSEGDRVLPPAK